MMKRIVSLLMIAVMLCSLSIVAVATADDGELVININTTSTEVKAGDTVTVKLDVPMDSGLASIGLNFEFDNSVFELNRTSGYATSNEDPDNPGTIIVGYATDSPWIDEATLASIRFKVKENPVQVKEKLFKVTVNTHKYSPSYGDAKEDDTVPYTSVVVNDNTKIVLPEPTVTKKFEVTAVDNGANTVVTVKDSEVVGAGKVYVATFVGGVLDLCQVKDLADGDLTFEGLTGDVKVYVWDNNMVPLLDTALDA